MLKLIDRRLRCQEVSDECPNDLLELMIRASVKDSGAAAEVAITANDVVEECKTIFFAGKHTTSNLLTWTTILLAMHPQWQEQAREEVLRVCGSRDTPTKDDLAKLKTVRSQFPNICLENRSNKLNSTTKKIEINQFSWQ